MHVLRMRNSRILGLFIFPGTAFENWTIEILELIYFSIFNENENG